MQDFFAPRPGFILSDIFCGGFLKICRSFPREFFTSSNLLLWAWLISSVWIISECRPIYIMYVGRHTPCTSADVCYERRPTSIAHPIDSYDKLQRHPVFIVTAMAQVSSVSVLRYDLMGHHRCWRRGLLHSMRLLERIAPGWFSLRTLAKNIRVVVAFCIRSKIWQ